MQSIRFASFPHGCLQTLEGTGSRVGKVSFVFQFESGEGVGEWLLKWEFVAGSKEKMYMRTQGRYSLQRLHLCSATSGTPFTASTTPEILHYSLGKAFKTGVGEAYVELKP